MITLLIAEDVITCNISESRKSKQFLWNNDSP